MNRSVDLLEPGNDMYEFRAIAQKESADIEHEGKVYPLTGRRSLHYSQQLDRAGAIEHRRLSSFQCARDTVYDQPEVRLSGPMFIGPIELFFVKLLIFVVTLLIFSCTLPVSLLGVDVCCCTHPQIDTTKTSAIAITPAATSLFIVRQ